MRGIFSMKPYLSLLFLFSGFLTAFSQEVQVILGPNEIGDNQNWKITATVHNGKLKSYDKFPEIKGFRKSRQSTQSTTSILKGDTSYSYSESVVMTYKPMQQGIIDVPSFTMKVNGKPVSVSGKSVNVGPPKQQQQDDSSLNFFEGYTTGEEAEFVDIKDDAFLVLTTSKDEVYVGEGFNATLSFLVSKNNRAPLQFYEVQRQLTEIRKTIIPRNCREENFNIESIVGESVRINDSDYTEYKLYQATFFPLKAKHINFPVVSLEMIKYKVAKHPSFFGENRKEDFKKFYTNAKTVKVKKH
jgi:hypothetical protein